MPSTFAQTVQLIAALAEGKEQRKRTRTAERQVSVAEQEQRYRRIDQAIALAQSSIPEVRLAALETLQADLKLPQQQFESLKEIARQAPIDLNTVKTVAVNQGRDVLLRNPERANAAMADAYTALTSGQSQGQVAGSMLGATVADLTRGAAEGLGPELKNQFALASLARLTGAPGVAAADRVMAQDPGLAAFAARAGAGQTMTAPQAASADIGRRGVEADIYRTNASLIAGATQAARGGTAGALTTEDVTQAIARMANIRETFHNAKATQAEREMALREYNAIAMRVAPELARTDPAAADPAGLIERLRNRVVPPGPPTGAASPYTNPLMPFLPDSGMFGTSFPRR